MSRDFLFLSNQKLLSQLDVRPQNVSDLMLVELYHQVTSRTAVLTWVELTWLLSKYLANSGSKCQTRVRVNVDLTNCTCSSLTQLLLWDTYCIWQLATVGVDDVHILLRN